MRGGGVNYNGIELAEYLRGHHRKLPIYILTGHPSDDFTGTAYRVEDMPPLALTAIPKTYAELRAAVEFAMIQGPRAVELAKVRTYHETGRLIREHLLANQDRADYGAQTIPRLAKDLKIDRSVLQRCDKFYRTFPIWATWPKLTWAHYKELIPIDDPKLRRSLATEANRNEWPVARLKARIAELAPAETVEVFATPVGEPPERLKPGHGTPGLHLIVERGEWLAVDLGFKLYWPLTAEQAKRLAKGDIVRIARDPSTRLRAGDEISRVKGATKADLFTYSATLRRVVDGDTLVVALEVSPGVFLEQKLRLLGLDAPEISTPEGRAAKRFVEALVAKATTIIIQTTKPDKYDQYLAGVFLMSAVSDKLKAESLEPSAEIFLNNALLENGHAVRKDAADFGDDWGFK